MQPRPSIRQIERHLRALKCPAEFVTKHVERLKVLRRVPRQKLVRKRKAGRYPSYEWRAVVE